MNVEVGARTDVGRVREMNQDSYLVDEPLFGVADGMGGHLAGDVASATAVETVERLAADRAPEGPQDLVRFLKEANVRVWEKAQADDNLQGMGTTFTLLHLSGAQGELAHVGDSRAYLLREGRFEQLTEDHTLVQRMVNEGRLRQEDVSRHPQRSVITRALGVDQELDVDLQTLELHPGDRLLICSDGLSSMVSDERIAELLSREVDVQRVADSLVEAANEAGGEDNITVVVLEVRDGGSPSPANKVETPAPAPPPERQQTEPRGPEGGADEEQPSSGRRWARTLLVTVVVLVALGGVAYAAINYALDNSWFVGANEEGAVTIYKGIPDEVLGMSLRETEEETSLHVDDLPETYREDLENGIKADSLEDARATVDDLEDRSRDFGTDRKRTGSD